MARYGCQDPTFESVGEWDHTDGPEAAGLFAQYGIDLIPSQRRELDLMCARKADGSPQALTIGICKPRQNGKSFAACYYSVWMCAVEGWNVLYTAHNGGTVTKFSSVSATSSTIRATRIGTSSSTTSIASRAARASTSNPGHASSSRRGPTVPAVAPTTWRSSTRPRSTPTSSRTP